MSAKNTTYKRSYHLAPLGSVWTDSFDTTSDGNLYKLSKIDNEYILIGLNGVADGNVIRRSEDPNELLRDLYRFTGKVTIEIE